MTDTSDPVAGSYGSLGAGAGYFVGQISLREETAAEAVEVADELVDEIFADFDRSAWTPEIPTKIGRAWLKVATGEYLERLQDVNVSDAESARARRFIKEGTDVLEAIADAGGPIINGERQGKTDTDEPGDRVVRIRVT